MIGEQRLPAPPERASALQQAGDFSWACGPSTCSRPSEGDPTALPVQVVQVQDIGTHWLVTGTVGRVHACARA